MKIIIFLLLTVLINLGYNLIYSFDGPLNILGIILGPALLGAVLVFLLFNINKTL